MRICILKMENQQKNVGFWDVVDEWLNMAING